MQGLLARDAGGRLGERSGTVTARTLRLGGGWPQQRWQRLPPRDRRMLWVMVVALLVAGLWSLWLEPLLKQRTHWQAELPRLQAQSRTGTAAARP